MDLTKVYYDQGGLSGNILQIVKREPEWAANRVQVGERALSMLSPDQRRAAEQGESAPTAINTQSTPCSHKFVYREYIGQTPGRCICGAIVP